MQLKFFDQPIIDCWNGMLTRYLDIWIPGYLGGGSIFAGNSRTTNSRRSGELGYQHRQNLQLKAVEGTKPSLEGNRTKAN